MMQDGGMKRASAFLSIFRRHDGAATGVEYALVASLISVVIIVGATALGASVNGKFQGVAGQVSAIAP
jgi:pilus assembly protein Flp/PilA